jgi:hypothetical protein
MDKESVAHVYQGKFHYKTRNEMIYPTMWLNFENVILSQA